LLPSVGEKPIRSVTQSPDVGLRTHIKAQQRVQQGVERAGVAGVFAACRNSPALPGAKEYELRPNDVTLEHVVVEVLHCPRLYQRHTALPTMPGVSSILLIIKESVTGRRTSADDGLPDHR
jgi:hypothetical protein